MGNAPSNLRSTATAPSPASLLLLGQLVHTLVGGIELIVEPLRLAHEQVDFLLAGRGRIGSIMGGTERPGWQSTPAWQPGRVIPVSPPPPRPVPGSMPIGPLLSPAGSLFTSLPSLFFVGIG